MTALTRDWKALSLDGGGRSGSPFDARTMAIARPRSGSRRDRWRSMSVVSSIRDPPPPAARPYGISGAGKEHPHRRSLVLRALCDDHPAAALHEALHFWEAQPSSPAGRLSRKVRLENTRQHVGLHADAIV